MNCKYGYFPENNNEFIITEPDIPRNWYNYLFNDHYITFTSQVGAGEGFLQDRLGARLRLVTDRAVYVVEKGNYWLANALPVEEEREEYSCTHGLGYSIIHVKKNGISTDYGLFVPRMDDAFTGCELSFVTVKNESNEERTISIVSYIETESDLAYTRQGYTPNHTEFKECFGGVFLDKFARWNGKNVTFRAGLMSDAPVTHYDCAKNAFIGTYGNIAAPKALSHTGHCTDSVSTFEKACFALENEITLSPGEEKRILYACVITENDEKLAALRERYLNADGFERELAAVKEHYTEELCDLKIETPFEDLNRLCNAWLPYATDMGSRWARVRHNGYRDMASDTECLASFNPKLAAERIKRILTFQYSNGYAPRTIADGKIKDNKFADCTVWLTYAVYTIVMELGDLSFLEEIVPFNDKTEATVYEHLRRSVDFLYNFKGLYGLVRIWGGDWNDNLNAAGLEGKGVSIWLTMAWYRANKQLCELAELLGKGEDAELCRVRGEEMRELVDRFGWDEQGYYIYAYNDDEKTIGSSRDADAPRICLNPQLWAVMSGISKDKKDLVAIENAEKLLRCDLGCRVQSPPFTKFDPKIGNASRSIPGTGENGSVYLHPMAWKLAVDGMLGRRDLMEKDLITLLPYRNPVVAGRAEPYVMCNCYFTEETGYRYGTPGQSWRTATGQWMLKAVIHYLFGLNGCMEGLRITPCLPASWETCRITKTFRGATYHITYRCGAAQASILVNGKPIEGNVVPAECGKTYEILVNIK